MTPSEARQTVQAHLGVYRAAFVEAPGWPLLDHPQARFTLCERVGHAYDALRDRKAHLVKMGYKVTAGSLGANVLRLELGDDMRVIGIDKPKKKDKQMLAAARTARQEGRSPVSAATPYETREQKAAAFRAFA